MRRDMARDLYAVLGVPLSCGAAEVKSAFRALALRHHPDKALAEGGAALRGAQESLFVLLSQAHSTLSDPVLRKRYDALRAARERAEILGDVVFPEVVALT